MAGEIVPVAGSKLAVGTDITPTVTTYLSRPCSGILAYPCILPMCTHPISTLAKNQLIPLKDHQKVTKPGFICLLG